MGAAKFIAEQFPDAVKKAAIMWPNLPVGRIQAARQRDAYEQAAGFEFVYANPTDVLVQDWGPIVSCAEGQGRRVDHRHHHALGDGAPPAVDE